MFEYDLQLTVEITQVANALAVRTPVPLSLHYRGGRWRAECDCPSISTPQYDRLEEAITAGARAVAAELQAGISERPIILGRITPADVPRGRF
ncbi:MAG: hypothetical protein HRF43_15805 [Phycisphaerae bacterium]|jgi:pantothenate kinase